ncbi:MAG: hypothetical protein J5365_04370 [Erysipelotrichaceae bacterium]|nr:hypothetical protein [Erysipelotrichaceae bacterium]
MRKLLLILLCIMFCSCARHEDLRQELDKVFTETGYTGKIRHNNFTRYVDYYLPSDIGEETADRLSSVLIYNRSRIIMDVNISGIINDRYYEDLPRAEEGFFDDSRLFYTKEGTYKDYEGNDKEYIFRIYEYDEDYLLHFLTKDLIFYAYGEEKDLIPVTSRIYLIARGAEVRSSAVLADFSTIDVIDYHKKQVNLFETIMPVNGSINDFMLENEEPETED